MNKQEGQSKLNKLIKELNKNNLFISKKENKYTIEEDKDVYVVFANGLYTGIYMGDGDWNEVEIDCKFILDDNIGDKIYGINNFETCTNEENNLIVDILSKVENSTDKYVSKIDDYMCEKDEYGDIILADIINEDKEEFNWDYLGVAIKKMKLSEYE